MTKPDALTLNEPGVRASLAVARKIIVEKIDLEEKFDAGALYEMTGQQLREYLAFAYREGRKAARS